jgi:hypothetical protein
MFVSSIFIGLGLPYKKIMPAFTGVSGCLAALIGDFLANAFPRKFLATQKTPGS